jgi:hypothetical protein
MRTRFLSLFALCGLVATSGLAARAVESSPTPPSDTTGALPSSAAPQFSGRINDVVTLAKSGVDQSIVVAYIKNSPGPFQPSADEIIKLRDIGISTPVLTAILERGAQVRDQARTAVAAASDQANTDPSQAPVISEETPPSTYAGSDYATQPASTVTYIGGEYGYSYPYYYPTYVSGYYSSAFFYPFPCWFGGIYYSHGCYFPHGGFIHDGFHVHDGFHNGGFHGGDSHGGFHGSGGGFHGGVTGGFHSGGSHFGTVSPGSFHNGFSVGGTHSMPVGGGMGRMPVGGGFHGSVGGVHGGVSSGGFHGGVSGGGGFHGGGSGGGHSGGGHR